MKAVLGAAGIAYPRSHDLLRLIELLAEASLALPAELQWIDALNPYAVGARYGLVEAGGLERARTLDAVAGVVLWAEAIVKRSA